MMSALLPAAAAGLAAPEPLATLLFFGPLTPILLFLGPLVLLVVVVYILYKILS